MQSLLVLGTSAELVGLANATLELTLEYIKLRQQFGKPLGSFQVLQHRAVNGYIDIELNRSLVYRTSSAWDAGQCHQAMVSALKARTSRSALEVTRAALQMHGAIGYYRGARHRSLLQARAVARGAVRQRHQPRDAIFAADPGRGRSEPMSGRTLHVDIAARGIATVTLNRPEKGNPYNSEMLDALAAEFARLGGDARVRVVLLRGAGRHFCVGADLSRGAAAGPQAAMSPPVPA